MIQSLDRTGTYRTYSMADGLTGVCIEHMAEDSEGYLWFATWDNGVSRFDGDEFQNFTKQDGLIDDRTYFVAQDSQNRLWFGTANGVCWYDGAKFHHLKDDGIADRDVQCIYEDNEGRIWCGGQRTLGYYDGTAYHDMIPLYLQHYKEPPSPGHMNHCRGIAEDPEGHMWFGFDYLIRFNGKSFHRYNEKEGFRKSRTQYSVSRDLTGKVWIGRFGHQDGLWCYADGNFQYVQVDLGSRLRRIQCDREGRMWFSTVKEVLYQDGDGFSRFTPADGLPLSGVVSVFQDRDHQFWFATPEGVVLYDAHSISVFDFSAELSKRSREISQIVQDRKGDIWIGVVSPFFDYRTECVLRFDSEHQEFASTESDFVINNCLDIYEDSDGCLWFGSLNGLFHYEGQKIKKVKTIADVREKSVCAIAQDSQGQFLFGCWEREKAIGKQELFDSPVKIVYQQGEQFQTIFTEDKKREEDKKRDMISTIGTIIAGHNGEVFFYFLHQNFSDIDKGFARWHPEEGLKFYGIEDGLIDDRVNDLLLNRNSNLWIATQSGLACFDGSTFRTFTTEDGLLCSRIHCLFEDSQGHLWLGTDRGVVHYDGQLFQTIKSPHIEPVLQILEDRDGNFWFGTIPNTLVRYRPRQTAPTVRLLQVIADKVYEDLEEVVLSTTDQQVIFEYKGMSFSTHPRDMLYIYRLKGYDADWQPATRKMRAYYRELRPGDYTFEVRAIDRDLNYSEIAQARLSVEMDPRISALTSVINNQDDNKFIGQSEALSQFQIQLRKVASTDLTVLMLGETGVGKGLAARVLHSLSCSCDGPFIQVNCGALPESLIDSELFGHERGAFTSAVSRRLGKVELARDGTLFLDEIGDMTLATQARLLHLLEEGTFERVGGSETLKAQTRIVAATNRNLTEMVNQGDFREDLYYRIQTFPLYLSPLRERKEDIPDLAEFFKNRMAAHLGKQLDPLTSEIIEVLQSYDWPGNVRELEHTIQRAVIVCQGSRIALENLGSYRSRVKGTALDLVWTPLSVSQDGEVVPLDEFERHYILEVLKSTKWQIAGDKGAATLLGLPTSTLYGKMRKLGIKRP